MQCIDKAILVSRATWKCAECGKDVSMMYVLWAEAMIANGENNIVTETKPWWKEEFDNLFTKTMNHTYLHHLGTSREALKMEQFILKVESETRKKTIEEVRKEITGLQKKQVHEPNSITWTVKYYDVLDLPSLQINNNE